MKKHQPMISKGCTFAKDRCTGWLITIRRISMAWNGGHYENVPLEWVDKINTQFRLSTKLFFALLNKVSRPFDGNWVCIWDQLFLRSSPFCRLLSFLIFLKHLYHEPDMFIVFNTKCHSVAQQVPSKQQHRILSGIRCIFYTSRIWIAFMGLCRVLIHLTVLCKIACGPSTFSAILYFYLLFIKYHKNAQFIKIIHYNHSEGWSHFVRKWNWRTYPPNGTRSVSFSSFLGKCRNSRYPLPKNRAKKNKIETNVKLIGKSLFTRKVCVCVIVNAISFMKMKMQMQRMGIPYVCVVIGGMQKTWRKCKHPDLHSK